MEDAAQGLVQAALHYDDPEPVNLGAGFEISMRELADMVVALGKDLVGYSGKVVQKTSADPDYLVDNPNRRCPVIAKARADLGYKPAIGLDEGLRRSLIWYGGNREAEEK